MGKVAEIFKKEVVGYELQKEYKQSVRYSYSKIAEIKTRKWVKREKRTFKWSRPSPEISSPSSISTSPSPLTAFPVLLKLGLVGVGVRDPKNNIFGNGGGGVFCPLTKPFGFIRPLTPRASPSCSTSISIPSLDGTRSLAFNPSLPPNERAQIHLPPVLLSPVFLHPI